MKEMIAIGISVLAFGISLYGFAFKQVGLSAVPTDFVPAPDTGEQKIQIAFQNYGNVDVLISEIEFDSVTSLKEGNEACHDEKRKPLSSEASDPADRMAFAVEKGRVVTKDLLFNDPIKDDRKRHYCVRFEVHDVFGKRYDARYHLITVRYLDKEPDNPKINKVALPIGKEFYFFKP